MKTISLTLLILFVASAWAVLEERKAIISNSVKSSDWANPGRSRYQPAPLVRNGNLTDYEATSNRDDQPFFIFLLKDYPVYVSYVEVTNRVDCCQSRIDPFTILVSADGEMWDNKTVDWYKANAYYSNWRDVSGTQSTYRVPFPHVFTIWARLQQHTRDFMNIAEVSFIQMYKPPYLTASASSIYPDTNPPLSNAYDALPNTWFATDHEANSNPWFEVTFAAQKICRVTIWNRWESCCSSRIDPFTVALKNGAFTSRPASVNLKTDYCTNEAGITCSTTQTGALEYYEVNFPTEPVADRVRIFQHTPGYLNFAEIIVYACSFPANFVYVYPPM